MDHEGEPDLSEPLLTAAEVASLARVDRMTVTRWVHAGHLAAIRLPGGRALRFRRSDVEAMLTPNTPAAEAAS